MSYSEYQNKDLQLAQSIADYKIRNSELERDIAMNKSAIANLEMQRAKLSADYYLQQENQ